MEVTWLIEFIYTDEFCSDLILRCLYHRYVLVVCCVSWFGRGQVLRHTNIHTYIHTYKTFESGYAMYSIVDNFFKCVGLHISIHTYLYICAYGRLCEYALNYTYLYHIHTIYTYISIHTRMQYFYGLSVSVHDRFMPTAAEQDHYTEPSEFTRAAGELIGHSEGLKRVAQIRALLA